MGRKKRKVELMDAGELLQDGQESADNLEPLFEQVVRARMGRETGVGVLEQLSFGPHARYGFKEFLDPAR